MRSHLIVNHGLFLFYSPIFNVLKTIIVLIVWPFFCNIIISNFILNFVRDAENI